MIHVDTHVLVWLRQGRAGKFPEAARQALLGPVRMSPMVELELSLLFEIRRLNERPAALIAALTPAIDLRVCDAPFGEVTRVAHGLTWTRDPFDRLIAAQAKLAGVPLLTYDGRIREHCPFAFWDARPDA